MLKNFLKYPLEFIFLAVLLLAIALLFIDFGNTPQTRLFLGVAIGVVYVTWSMFYHWRRGDFTLSILVEYLLFALLGVVVLSSTVF